MAITVENLAPGDARAVYKNCNYNMRQYKHLQMFVHANALSQNTTQTVDGETSIFIRLGSDYKSNYYKNLHNNTPPVLIFPYDLSSYCYLSCLSKV